VVIVLVRVSAREVGRSVKRMWEGEWAARVGLFSLLSWQFLGDR
jgi:hypothetical protein